MDTQQLSTRVTYERLDNGVDVYVLPTNTRDVVVCRMALPGGVYRTYNKQVVALLRGELLPGGVRGMKRNEVRDALDALGVRLSIVDSTEHLMVSLSARSAVFADALSLVLDVLTVPLFRTDEFAEALARIGTALAHAKEDTNTQARVAGLRLLYQKGHPHWPTLPSESLRELARATLADVRDFHTGTISAVGAVVCITGDVKARACMRTVREICARLPEGRPSKVPSVHVDRTVVPAQSDVVVPLRDQMNVDTFLTIPVMLTRESDDYHALAAGLQILGGGATGRLFIELRMKQNLTYHAYASLGGLGDGYAGFVQAAAILPNDVFLKGRTALRAVVREWAENGVTSRELGKCKVEIAGKHKVGLASTKGACAALFGTVTGRKPVSYIDEYPGIVGDLTLREVNNAIKKYVSYDLAVTAGAGAIDKRGKPM